MALANLGALAADLGKLEAATAYAERAIRLVPGDGRQRNNLGNMLMRLNRFPEAGEVLEVAKQIAPDDPVTWQNLALLSYREGKLESALEYMETALRLSPNHRQMQCDRGHILLALGRLREGLVAYENRWYNLLHLEPWDLGVPEWKGEDLDQKHILFHSEQGFGDALMMSRFAWDLVSLGAQVTMALPPGLVRLFRLQEWPGVTVLGFTEIYDKTFDFHSPMFSALRWLGYEKQDIHPAPYLKNHLPPLVVTPDLQSVPNSEFKVGICWASGKWNADTALRRTIDLRLFLPLASVPGVKLWSLQKGEGEGDIQTLGAEGLIQDTMRSCKDWADTAALVESLDLVIAVDTAVAHLAGAMGKEVWMLGPHTRCWRWWNTDRGSGAPWYQNMTIFPQSNPGSWVATMEDVIANLMAKSAPALKEAAD
jgi:hypothetical protein